MNYNNYGGYSNGRYFTNTPYQQYPYIPRQMEQQPQQQNGIFFNNIRYISPEDMDKYIVNLGNTDMLINMQDGLVKIKSADMAGNSFERNFKFEEIKGNAQTTQPVKEPEEYVKKDDIKDFIKTDDFNAFSDNLTSKIEALEKKIKIKEIMGDE